MAKAHTDRVIDIDDCLAIDCVAGRYIHLIKGDFAATIWGKYIFDCGIGHLKSNIHMEVGKWI